MKKFIFLFLTNMEYLKYCCVLESLITAILLRKTTYSIFCIFIAANNLYTSSTINTEARTKPALSRNITYSIFCILLANNNLFSSGIIRNEIITKPAFSRGILQTPEFKNYISQLESFTPIPIKQKNFLYQHLQRKIYPKLTGEENKEHSATFVKFNLMRQWESHIHKKWPTFNKKRNRKKYHRVEKIPYHFHHIIPRQYSGPHVWWNGFPIKNANHTFIHSEGNALSSLLKRIDSMDSTADRNEP